MAIDCTCNNTLQNLGSPDCPPVMQIARKFIFVPKYKADGSENRLDLDPSEITKSNLLTLINASNPQDRYYPTAQVDNTEDTRAEPITQEFNSGKIITVREGARTNTSIVPLGSTQELGHYKSFGCSEFGAYVIDAGGNFIYYDEGDGKDLGHIVEFKSEVQLSLDIFSSSELGFSYNHISNASLGDKNPGANSYMFNFLKRF